MDEHSVLGEGRFLRLVRAGGWEFAERRAATGVVAIVAVTGDQRLVLTEQHRVPVGCPVIDLPAGLVGDEKADEERVAAAARELEEETGFAAERLEAMVEVPTSPGLSNEVVTLYRALGVRRTGDGGGVAGERITVHVPPLSGIRDWLAQRTAAGAMIDLKVWAALALV